jgi:hypothetical protein
MRHTGAKTARRLRRALVYAVAGLVAAAAVVVEVDRSALAALSTLTRYPYLTDVIAGSATVNWATQRTSAVTGSVRWGQAGVESCTAHTTSASKTSITVNSVAEYQWKATLTGLNPDTPYCYRIYLGQSPPADLLGAEASPQFTSQLAAGASKPFTFVVFGDWGQANAGGANTDQANLLSRLVGSGARFAVATGDTGYPTGSQTNYGDLQQVGKNISGVFGPQFWATAGASIPLFSAVGNHSPDATFLLNWPHAQAATSSGGRWTTETYCCLNGTASKSYASAWYAFDAGTARFYVLDAAWSESNRGTADGYKNDYDYHWTPTSAEYQWLENDLATHPSSLKFAFFHYPLYSDQSTETSDSYLRGTASLEGLLSRYGVDIAFNGHGHVYQRNLKPGPQSLVTYVTAGGGAQLQSMGGLGCSANDAYGIGWKDPYDNAGSACGSAPVPTSRDRVFHLLLVKVDGSRVTVTPTDELGRTFDPVTYDFGADGAQPPTAPSAPTATAAGGSVVNLSWSPSADDIGVNGYTVSRDGQPLATVSGWTTGYVDHSVQPLTSYSYTVAASDGNGNASASSDPATVVTGSANAIFTFTPTDDSYVDGSVPDANYGSEARLFADNTPVRSLLLKFSVSGLNGCQVLHARIRLYDVDGSPKGGDFHNLPDSSWSEATVTSNTAPAADPAVVASLGTVAPGNWYEADVTPLVGGDGIVSLRVTSTSSDGAGYASKEDSQGRKPQLVVECAT